MFSFFKPSTDNANKLALATSVLALKFFGTKAEALKNLSADGIESLNVDQVLGLFLVGGIVMCCCLAAFRRRPLHALDHHHHNPAVIVAPVHEQLQHVIERPHDHLLVQHGSHLHDVAIDHHGHMEEVDLRGDYAPPVFRISYKPGRH